MARELTLRRTLRSLSRQRQGQRKDKDILEKRERIEARNKEWQLQKASMA